MLEPDADWQRAGKAAGREEETRDLEDPVYGPWWYVSPRRLLGKMLVIVASMGLMMFALTEWLKYEWENAPMHYPDGRVVQPSDRQKSGSWVPHKAEEEVGASASCRAPGSDCEAIVSQGVEPATAS